MWREERSVAPGEIGGQRLQARSMTRQRLKVLWSRVRTREEENERKKFESEKEIGRKRDGEYRGEGELCCRQREISDGRRKKN